MIPSIGLIIGAYVILRCIDLMCARENRYKGKYARIIVSICCVVTILMAGEMMFSLAIAGGGTLSSFASPFVSPAREVELPRDPRAVNDLIRRSHEGH
jgi:hypothetical protein